MRYVCLDCGPEQKEFEVYAIHRLYVYTDEHGNWQEDGETIEVEHGDEYRCTFDRDHRVEYRDVTNIDRLKQAVDK
jgi:hypothetical protein